MRSKILIGVIIALICAYYPTAVEARRVHSLQCNQCHKNGVSFFNLDNLCLQCHSMTPTGYSMYSEGVVVPEGKFNVIAASNAIGSNDYQPVGVGQTSHMWSGSDYKPKAGAQPATIYAREFNGSYGVSRGQILCYRCHQPHGLQILGAEIDQRILKVPVDDDQACKDCHLPWVTSDPDAYLTHPMVENYYNVALADPARFYNSVVKINNADVRLLYNSVTCTTCHGVHFTDSSSASVDDKATQYNAVGDGNLLRSDGPNAPSAQGQSNLCQACHTYQLHGDADGGEKVGCLGCHGGHSYNDGVPNYFILKDDLHTDTFSYVYNVVFNSVTYNLNDMKQNEAGGYCERCHGDAYTAITGHDAVGRWDVDCRACHSHKVADGGTYSWQNEANIAVCGDCHGFPPYIDQPGDWKSGGGTEGGYAVMDGAVTDSHTYAGSSDYKDESITPHNAHAAGGISGVSTDNKFGAGTGACNPCHDGLLNHKEVDNPTSFRNIAWSTLSTGYNALSPSYDGGGTFKCSNTYCHSNGGKRTGDGTRLYNAVTTPGWDGAVGAPGTNGKGSIIGKISPDHECSFCHGNSASTMHSTDKDNSFSHQAHLGAGTLLKNYDCTACHKLTAASSTVLYNTARWNGTHVNGQHNVDFNSTYSLGNGNLTWGAPYNYGTGVCSVYCHSDGTTMAAPDWDDAATGDCGACHNATAATLNTGSHSRHLDSTKANISCDECHGTDASIGKHAGHIDGAITKLPQQDSCDVCHGVEVGDVAPTWGDKNSVYCETCHTGTKLCKYPTAVPTVFAPDKSVALTAGHNYNSTTVDYAVTGNPSAKKVCTDCHIKIDDTGADGHVDGLGNDSILVAGFACEDCHTAAGRWTDQATVDVKTHANDEPLYNSQRNQYLFSKACIACHDPHGSSNIAMVGTDNADFTDFSGIVEFLRFNSLTLDNSFDEIDGGAGNNVDDICATCHTATSNNATTVSEATKSHNEGKNCLNCHTHDGANGGFMPLGGEWCSDCHGNPPDVAHEDELAKIGAHQAHTRVQVDNAAEDLSDCAVCHQGADTFGLPSHSTVQFVPAIGYNATDGTCSGACHISTVADGYWTDTAIDGQGGNGLNCDSCHYYETAPSSYNSLNHDRPFDDVTHGKHFDAGKVCTDCHDVVSADIGSHIERVHIDDYVDWTVADDDTVLADRGTATDDEATVIAAALNTGIDNDPGTLTCDNMTCHDPSGVGYNVIWNTTPGLDCALCHALSPGSGSHPQHLAPSVHATYGKTIACADCHVDNSGNTAHLDSSVTFAGGISYNSLSNHTCNTATCHNDGLGSPVETPQWGQPSATVCATCHSDGASNPQPATGRHGQHIENSFYVTDCGKCHVDATATQYNSANHLNASTETGSQITGGTLPQCTNTCHLVDATGTWTDANALDCVECHVSGKMVAAPSSGLHTGTLTISDNTHDGNFKVTRNEVTPSGTCTTCHTKIDLAANTPATHAAGGSMQIIQAGATLYNDISYTYGTPSSCAPGSGCHDDGGAWKRLWSTTAKNSNGTECANCHGDFDAGNGFVVGISLRHSKADVQLAGGHDGVDKCYICHTYKKGDATYYNVALQHRDGDIQLNYNMTFVDDGDTVHCEGCHNNESLLGIGDGLYSFQDTYNGTISRWGRSLQDGPDANCTDCHDTNGQKHDGANESATLHSKHAGSPFSGSNCVFCHADSGPSGGNHNDGWVDFGGTYLDLARYNSQVAEGGGDFPSGNCSAGNGCHDSSTDPTSWNTVTLPNGCVDCHSATGKLFDQGGYPPTSNAHSAHTDNNSLIADPDCDNCHGAGASTGDHGSHKDNYNTVYNTAVTSYTAATGVCGNTCHYVAEWRGWNDGADLACADCHNATELAGAARSLDRGGWPVGSAKHSEHISNNSLILDPDCDKCHGTDAVAGTHVGHKDNTYNTVVSYDSGTKTCTITCHQANTTNDWTVGGSLACLDCHSGTYVGGGSKAPASGLHAIVPTNTGATHDQNLLSGNCVNCHAPDPSTKHKDNVLDSWSASVFSYNATNVTSYNAAVGCQATCHADGGDWARQWSDTADNSDGAECANCHGGIGVGYAVAGWNDGAIPDHTIDYGDADAIPEVMGSHHYGCKACHGFNGPADKSDNYNAATMHRNNQITMNSDTQYNATNYGCDNAGCHLDYSDGHAMADSGWGVEQFAFGGGDCDSCHAGADRTHLGAGERLATHTLHKDSALFAGGCAACHPHDGSVPPLTEPHGTGTVNFANKMSSLDNYSGDYSIANCSTNGCHNSKPGDWTALSNPLACIDCHNTGVSKSLRPNDTHPPISGKHSVHMAQFGLKGNYVAGGCVDCHGTGADTGTHVGHRDNDPVYNTVFTNYNGDGSCGNNCHNASLSSTWQSGSLVCADCHNSDKSLDASNGYIVDAANAPDTGEHTIHMSQDGAKGDYVAGGCTDCHGHSGESVASHVDGPTVNSITVANSVSSYNAGDGGCINACHAVNPIPAGDWIDAGRLACSDCHAGGGSLQLGTWPVVSNKHTQHIDNNTYVPGDCADCHGAGATEISDGTHTGHKDSVVTLANSVTLYNSTNKTCDNSCHIADTTNDWTLTATLACVDCHSGAYVGKLNRDNTSGLHVAYNATAHDDRFGAGDTGTCTSCHTSMTVPLPDTHVNGNDTETGSAFALFTNYNATNSDCTASCHRDGGNWRRLWKDAVDVAATGDPGQQVCGNCHGQYVSVYNSVGKGWRAGTVHFRSGSGYNEDKGSSHNKINGNANACFDCHAYPGNAVHNSNDKVDFSSNTAGTPAGYNVAMGGTGLYCTGASCHDNNKDEDPLGEGSHTFFNSLSFAERNWVFSTQLPEGGCTNCHGNMTNGTFWPDGLTSDPANDHPGAHLVHVESIADEMTIDPLTGPGTGTTEEKNATCDYCHEIIGHSGPQGEPAELCKEDWDGDGSTLEYNAATATFNYIIGGINDNGIGSAYYRRPGPGEPDGRCSLVDCHANAPYTPGWYGDTVAPGLVTPVTSMHYNSTTGGQEEEPGSVLLTWFAPGDDNGDDGTAYRYEVRYSDSDITNITSFNSATIAGGPPTVDRQGKSQRMVVKGLTPGNSYYFAVRTFDEVGNASSIPASAVPGTAHLDDMPPGFYGIDSVIAGDTTGEIKLKWTGANEHSYPVTYRAWWSGYALQTHLANGGTLPTTETTYDPGTPPTSPGTGPDKYTIYTKVTSGTSLRLEDMNTTILYNFLVRAKDGVGNEQIDNDVFKYAMAKKTPEEGKSDKTYYASGTNVLVDNIGSQTTGSSNAYPITFTFATGYQVKTNFFANSFDIYASNGNGAGQITAQLGYDGGSGFTPFGTPLTATANMISKAKRVLSFKFFGEKRIFDINQKLAIQFTNTGGSTITLSWGGTNKGNLSAVEQRYNNLPSQVTIDEPLAASGVVPIDWTNPATDADGDTLHYDVYAVCNSGYNSVIESDLPPSTTVAYWDTYADYLGTSVGEPCTVYVATGDKINSGDGSGTSHTIASASQTISNPTDAVPPAQVTDLSGETRPKQGSVYLSWTAVGSNGLNGGQRATAYDIRYSTSVITEFNSATPLTGEPVPNFGEQKDHFEVLGLEDERDYFFALKVGDGNNWSQMSNVTPPIMSGPKCGICHSTPPDEPVTAGNHSKHGYTMTDCADCHGTAAASYPMAHQDGKLVLGFNTADDPVEGVVYNTVGITYTQNGNLIYKDADGTGGCVQFGDAGDGEDDGTCMNFAQAGVKCHGPAKPSWDVDANLDCSACHGDYDDSRNRAYDPYNRPYDDTGEEPYASPPVDLQGAETGKVVGQHLKHLNFSFRFSKGDSCDLCHFKNEHGDNNVDINLDPVGAGAGSHYNALNVGPNGGGKCFSTTLEGCHGPTATPEWHDNATVTCNNCHGMAGKAYTEDAGYGTSEIGHVYLVKGGTVAACTDCHVAGHPQGTSGDYNTLMIPNNRAVGLGYRSGGVHVMNSIASEGPFSTEAELCWGCHDQDDDGDLVELNGDIDEFDTNTYNTTGNMLYDYGTLNQASWVGATWTSAMSNFGYKTGLIQSTHTANSDGTSAVNWTTGNGTPGDPDEYDHYKETTDAVATIRCSWCHDVHDLNFADNDTTTGAPYLRGSWKGNPYKEDGAPQLGQTYTVPSAAGNPGYGYGAVPRSGWDNSENKGGYFIDQNSGNPTAGWSYENSAGLCILCHGGVVDTLDQTTDSVNLWVGNNGHANAAVGGTAYNSVNIFDNTLRNGDGANYEAAGIGPWMGYQNSNAGGTYGLWIRSGYYVSSNPVDPLVVNKIYPSGVEFAWGVLVTSDGANAEPGHQFSCSKCHNPHASRLPKLMITNCLDVRHNKWDDTYKTDAGWDTSAYAIAQGAFTPATYNTKEHAYSSTAQNCHRYIDLNHDGAPDEAGWNKVTPW